MSSLDFPNRPNPGQGFPTISTWEEPGVTAAPAFSWDSQKKVWSKSVTLAIPEGQKLIAYPTVVDSNSNICLLWDDLPEEPVGVMYNFRRYLIDLTLSANFGFSIVTNGNKIRGAGVVLAPSCSTDTLIFFAVIGENDSIVTCSNLVLVRAL